MHPGVSSLGTGYSDVSSTNHSMLYCHLLVLLQIYIIIVTYILYLFFFLCTLCFMALKKGWSWFWLS
ncbi:hypothetical protein GQ55_1G169400 [Panicum hallii var. hallii]|uniref:Uncharacterized protein n=1 Tax=Panicum hallii var. hallii TaxID=1504633 RepID=A0A2T7F5T6_9POAL|nr:hypothetical protein GQ55_1G169400 [Panicum hallii var. hallii]